MSLAVPPHPFGGHIFTDTLFHKKHTERGQFNYWIIIMTGAIFFAVLSWYNFCLVLYNYWLGIPSPLAHETPNQELLASGTFALIWSTIVILIYLLFSSLNLLTGNPNVEFHDTRYLNTERAIEASRTMSALGR